MKLTPKPPVALVCFDRPEYTESCVQALARADGISARQVAVFVDGPPPGHWGGNDRPYQRADRRSIQERIRAVCDTIGRNLPEAKVFAVPSNLGIALNTRRALQWSFLEQGADFAYILEDDVVVSPAWLNVMDLICDIARLDQRIGHFSAHGAHGLSQREQGPESGQLFFGPPDDRETDLRAVGQSREHFLEVDAMLAPFYSGLTGIDYRSTERQRSIMRFETVFRVLGGRPPALGQDGLREWASYCRGYVPAHTQGSWTRYVGALGVNGDLAHFNAMRYAHTHLQVMTPQRVVPPDDTSLRKCQEEMDQRFSGALREKKSSVRLRILPRRYRRASK